jgi:large subunit ribosomal protein L17
MRHQFSGRKLSRTKNERRRLLQGLVRDVILRDSITTTLAKAKAVQPLMEKLVTKAKQGTSSSLTSIRQVLADKRSVDRLLEDARTRFSGRNSGYTRIIKLGKRTSDASEMVVFGFVDGRAPAVPAAETKTNTGKAKAKPAATKAEKNPSVKEKKAKPKINKTKKKQS